MNPSTYSEAVALASSLFPASQDEPAGANHRDTLRATVHAPDGEPVLEVESHHYIVMKPRDESLPITSP